VYTWIQTNPHSLLRQLSGPRPLCRDVDMVPKPHICDRGALAVSFNTQPGTGRVAIPPASNLPRAGATSTSMLNAPVSLIYVKWKSLHILPGCLDMLPPLRTFTLSVETVTVLRHLHQNSALSCRSPSRGKLWRNIRDCNCG
jgi:hypothetical protein